MPLAPELDHVFAPESILAGKEIGRNGLDKVVVANLLVGFEKRLQVLGGANVRVTHRFETVGKRRMRVVVVVLLRQRLREPHLCFAW